MKPSETASPAPEARPARAVVSLWSRARGLARTNVAVYLAGTLLSRIGGVLLIPLYTRRLTPEDYGEYSIAVSIFALLPTCASLGLTAGLAREFYGSKERRDSDRAVGSVARGMMVVIALTLGLLALALVLFAPPSLFGVSRRHLLLVIAASAAYGIALVPDMYFRAAQRPVPAVLLQLLAFTTLAGSGLLLVLGCDRALDGALEAIVVSNVIMGAVAVGFVLRRLPAGNVVSETRRALAFSLPFVPHVLAGWLQLTADRWVLTAHGASASLGMYYLATQVLSPVPMVIGSWNDAESARLGELYRERGAPAAYAALPRLYRSYAAAALLPATAILVCSPLIPALIGPKFLGAIGLLPALALSHVIDTLYYPATNYVFFAGRTRFIPGVSAVSALVGVALALALLPRHGILGLLASRCAASAVRAGLMMAAARLARPATEGH